MNVTDVTNNIEDVEQIIGISLTQSFALPSTKPCLRLISDNNLWIIKTGLVDGFTLMLERAYKRWAVSLIKKWQEDIS